MIYKKILSSHKIKRELPKNFSQSDIEIFEHELQRDLPDVYIVEEEMVTIHNNGRVVNRNNIELKEFSSFSFKLRGKKAWLLRILTPFLIRRKSYKGTYYWGTDEWSYGFFHWVMDALPRIFCLNELDPKGKLLIPEEYKVYDFVRDSLKTFDLEIVYYKAPIKVNKLITCTYLAPTGNYNTDVLNKLRNKYLEFYSSVSEEPYKNIYISRKKAYRRKLLNEDELINILTEFNFEIVYLEDYNWEEKIKLMGRTKNVISIHGAGLTNCLFMKEGTNMIELRKVGDKNNNAYFSLANALQLNYYYLACAPLNEEGVGYDLLVDKEAFKNMLEKVMVEEKVKS